MVPQRVVPQRAEQQQERRRTGFRSSCLGLGQVPVALPTRRTVAELASVQSHQKDQIQEPTSEELVLAEQDPVVLHTELGRRRAGVVAVQTAEHHIHLAEAEHS